VIWLSLKPIKVRGKKICFKIYRLY